MKRLTHRYMDGEAYTSIYKVSASGESEVTGEPISRLAAYEDTGLTAEEIEEFDVGLLAAYKETGLEPEEIALYREAQEISESMAPDRLIEISKAEQDGRLVVLPCKIGDAVWAIKNFKGHERARMGYVSEMFFTKYMKLFIVVKNTGRGFWGEGVFPSEAGAVAALERRKENT